jgi:hypothetical protein
MEVPDLILHALVRQTALSAASKLRLRPELAMAIPEPLDPVLQDFGDTVAWLLLLGRDAEPFLETLLTAYTQEARQDVKTDRVIEAVMGTVMAAGHSTDIVREDMTKVVGIIEPVAKKVDDDAQELLRRR